MQTMPKSKEPTTTHTRKHKNLWRAIPYTCKANILSRLSNEEAALAAGVSREFKAVIKKLRHLVHLLSLPSDLSVTGLQGLVASHTDLRSLSFRKCSAKLRQFLPILEAAAGVNLKNERPRSLEVIDFRNCIHLSDSDVNALCVLHSRLHDINLANCTSITDAALVTLSKYEQSALEQQQVLPCKLLGAKQYGEPGNLVDHHGQNKNQTKQYFDYEMIQGEKGNGKICQPFPTEARSCQYVLKKIKNSDQAIPVLMDALKLTSKETMQQGNNASQVINQGDFSVGKGPAMMQVIDDGNAPAALMQVDSGGTKYMSYKVESVGDKQLATRERIIVPNLLASKNVDLADFAEKLRSSRAVHVAGATQVTDRRVQLLPKNNSDQVVEAFTTTMNDIGVYIIADESSRQEEPTRVDPRSKTKYDVPVAEKKYAHSPNSNDLALQPLRMGNTHHNKAFTNIRNKEREVVALVRQNSKIPETTDILMNDGADENVEKFKGLRALSMSGCCEITDKGVQALLKGPSKDSLLSLDISKCGQITGAGLRLPLKSALEVLTATQMLNIVRLTLQLTCDIALQHLFLTACPKLEDLCVMSINLQTLNVSSCVKLVRMQLKCPTLASLDFSLCENFEAFGRFYCNALLSVNATGCRLLTPAAMSTILDSASGLQELRCGGCDRLDRIDIPQKSLLHLEVSACPSLRRLYAYSKVLKVLEACGCKNLTEVHLFSSLLRRMLFSNCPLLKILVKILKHHPMFYINKYKQICRDAKVIPMDAIKESVDAAVKNRAQNKNLPDDGFEISISGCNMPESVRKNLAKLTKQWKACFKSSGGDTQKKLNHKADPKAKSIKR